MIGSTDGNLDTMSLLKRIRNLAIAKNPTKRTEETHGIPYLHSHDVRPRCQSTLWPSSVSRQTVEHYSRKQSKTVENSRKQSKTVKNSRKQSITVRVKAVSMSFLTSESDYYGLPLFSAGLVCRVLTFHVCL